MGIRGSHAGVGTPPTPLGPGPPHLLGPLAPWPLLASLLPAATWCWLSENRISSSLHSFAHDLVIVSSNKANGVQFFSFLLPALTSTSLSSIVKEDKACTSILIIGPQHNGLKETLAALGLEFFHGVCDTVEGAQWG